MFEYILAMLAASLFTGTLQAGLSYGSAQQNIQAQKDINNQNVEAQKEINQQNVENQIAINQQNIDYSREFAQNNIQWKMADLEAAGLNPTMAAGMSGSSTQPTALSSPYQQAPKQQAPILDLSGVSSALNAMSNAMMTAAVFGGRSQNYNDRTDALKEHWNRSSMNGGFKAASKVMNSANKMADTVSSKEWNKMLKELEKIGPYKY